MSQGLQKKYKKPQQANNFRSQINAGKMESEMGEKVYSKSSKTQTGKVYNDVDEKRRQVNDSPSTSDTPTITSLSQVGTFDLTTVPRNAFILTIASRRSGKSHLITHFLEQFTKKNKTDGIFLFTKTNAGFEGIPSVFRYKTLDVLEDLIETQVKVKKHNLKAKKKDKVHSNIIVILDDMVGQGGMGAEMRKNPLLNKLAVNGRHLSSDTSNMMVILISQIFVGISPQIRLNTDFLFTTKLAARRERENIVNSFLSLNSGRRGLAESYEIFDSTVNKDDFNFIAIHTTKQNKKKFSDYVFSFKAPKSLENRKLIGNEEDWKAHRDEVYW
jgi:hypothetical protein